MRVLRNLLFYFAFYAASVFFVSGSVVAMFISPPRVRWYPDQWARFHRGALRLLLGITVHETGTRPPGAVLYAIKHESIFEAIDLPAMLDFPRWKVWLVSFVVFLGVLFSIPSIIAGTPLSHVAIPRTPLRRGNDRIRRRKTIAASFR